MQLRRPSPGSISSAFGPRRSPGGIGSTMHQGVDFSWSNNGKQDWNVYAAAAGTVEFAAYNGGWGNLIIITHGNGRKTYYAHLARFNVRAGQWVNAGAIIGVIGNTGNSVGPHLHFELRINGTPVDPMPYFAGTAGGDVTPIKKDEDMTTYELWRTAPDSPTVWFVVNRLWRYGIPNETSLSDYAFFIRQQGQSDVIRTGAAGSLGVPVYRDGTVISDTFGKMPAPLTQAQITKAVKDALADTETVAVEIDEDALAEKIAAAINFPTTITGTLS